MPTIWKEGYRGKDRIRREYFQSVVGVIYLIILKGVGFENTRHVVV